MFGNNQFEVVNYLAFEHVAPDYKHKTKNDKVPLADDRASHISLLVLVPAIVGDSAYYKKDLHRVAHYGMSLSMM